MRCRWIRPAPAAANLDDLRVTWFWPGNSLEGNRQLRPYIAASARCAGRGPGGRGSDELRAPDLRAMRQPSGGGPVPGLPGGPGSRPPPLRGQPAADHRRRPGAGLRAPAGPSVRPVAREDAPRTPGLGGDPPDPLQRPFWRIQRISASMNSSISPSRTDRAFPVSMPVRTSLTFWYG